ncbi:MAG: HlyD family type I secretion periplasmic adaptor subunit [Crocosphaera sp.]|nr:HlyD family type I secretion periplasmic adaptor subunit [Crocosphaera sp.]MDJ0686804.1 HlyD family type I secretion periplasmic adaptor subunit [Alphaproteobacteria bacterium]
MTATAGVLGRVSAPAPSQQRSAGAEAARAAPPAKTATATKTKQRGKRTADERAFLPAALEILETPASPAARWTGILLAVFFTIAIAWSVIGTIDMVAVAQGRIVPAGGVKQIQPRDIGVVRSIHVKNGQHVTQGEILVRLDPTESEVDHDQLVKERAVAEIDLARLHAMLRRLDGAAGPFQTPDGADPVSAEMAEQRLNSDMAAFEARISALDAEMARAIADRDSVRAEIQKLRLTLPLIEEREQALARLVEKGVSPRPNWLEVKTQLIETQQEVAIQTSRLAEAEAAMVAAVMNQDQVRAEAKRETLAEFQETRRTYDQAVLALKKAALNEELQTLRAPADGVIQQLAVHTVGGVVQPAEPLMVLVPDDAPLEISAMVLNKDKGFVRAGHKAEIKIESFPFTKYGLIPGDVQHLSGDAIQDEQLGLVYEARVALNETTILADGETVPLTPGMNVTVEVKTGERQIIEFLISPLLRYQDEAFRER